MQKWEYLQLYFGNSYENDVFRVTVSINGELTVHDNPDVPALRRDTLNTLGEAGWELVATDSMGFYLFKRPIGNRISN